MFNLRADKGFMRYSVEVRLPFSSSKSCGIFDCYANKLQIQKNFGKYYFRKYVEKKIDRSVSNAPKTGMGAAIWHDKK